MLSNRLLVNLGAALFGAIILLGEAFKLNVGFANISLPLLLLGVIFLLVFNKRLRIYKTNVDFVVYSYGAVFLLFTFFGLLSGHHLGDIFEDLYPTFVFLLLFVVWRSFSVEQLAFVWKAVILFSILAAFKVFLIAVVPFEILWDNNWQAMKEALPLAGFYRIILRGGDVFLSFALVFLLINVQRKDSFSLYRNLLLIVLLIAAVFISLSRSSFLGIGVALITTFILCHQYFSTKKMAIFSAGVVVILLILLPFFNTISLAASIFEARTDAFDADNISVDFRKDEQAAILKKASTVYYMGNGLGSYVYLDLSGSDKKDERSIYAHDFNTWLVFKTGILGWVLFYIIFFKCSHHLYWCLKQKVPLNNQYQSLLLTLLASGIVVVIISFLANKLSTVSGSVFFAFYAATSVKLKQTYESSI
ncbi:MAG TPA: O-antigen ligase family protein [Flavisolibacter sp.]|jgi:hypothetical protein|nr:O-antigen ligase family protein [Flavisolibacter sp.]